MNGLEALEEIKKGCYSNCDCCNKPKSKYHKCLICKEHYLNNQSEMKIIEKELKVLQILKKKEVEIDLIKTHIYCNFSIEHLTEIYNKNIGSSYQQLTLEEMQQIIEVLKEKE